ncbi:MAG: crossover junction endodeoxyribonuclease RuvC, partial [Nitrospinota bacterium]|nr:crossover junction endodeoxyribonuclease RuvC [Nitrospinota bacterium]
NIFFAQNAKSALKLGQVRGAAILAAINSGLKLAEYSPLEIKQSITGYGRADKNQMQSIVTKLLCLKESPKPLDASDALSVAICHLHSAAFKEKCNISLQSSLRTQKLRQQ